MVCALIPSGALIYLNSADRMLALDRSGRVVRDSGPMADLDPGGAVFGPDGRFYVTMRRRRTILGISAKLDGHAGTPPTEEGIVPFPRGFAFGRDGSLYLASGIGPSAGRATTPSWCSIPTRPSSRVAWSRIPS